MSECALCMLAIMLPDKYGAYGGAVRTEDEKVTKGAREIHIIAFKTQSRFVLAQLTLAFQFLLYRSSENSRGAFEKSKNFMSLSNHRSAKS